MTRPITLWSDRVEGAFVAAFPLLLAFGVPLIPVVGDYADHAAAALATERASLWFDGHLVSAIAFGFGIVAATILCRRVAEAGSVLLARVALPMMAAGAALHMAGLGADGIGPLAVAEAGGDPRLFFDGSGGLVPMVFIAGAALFGVGQLVLVAGLRPLTGARQGRLLMAAAVVFSAAEAIPSGWGLYLVALAALALYLPLARMLWKEAQVPG
ncbi:MAG: hypothetical protein H8E31_14125 [Planctomycetes bacterium]|nr:hypothetical protein [Planctomycetota bacterium]